MKRLIVILLALAGMQLHAQTPDSLVRKETISQARYLKSIFKTDEAIEKLSALVKPEVFDIEVLSELADCHFQSGDYEGAAGTYFMLSSVAPRNILYKIRLMQVYTRLKDWPNSIQAGKAVLQLDSIPAVLSSVGDSFRQMEKPDSALWYYRKSLAKNPMNATVLSKAVNVLIVAEDYDGAIAMTEAFLAEDPDNTMIAPLKGLAFYRKGDYDAAVTVFQRQ